MPPKKNRKNASSTGAGASGIVTRSQKSENGPAVAEMTYYSTLADGKKSKSTKNNIQVISKKKLASDPAHYAELVRHIR